MEQPLDSNACVDLEGFSAIIVGDEHREVNKTSAWVCHCICLSHSKMSIVR